MTTAMSAIDPAAVLGELAAQRPARTVLFERLHIDYCCGGARTLAEACEQQGLDIATVCRLIEAFDAAPAERSADVEDRDWQRTALGDLCDHIVVAQHEGLRRELPEIAELLDSVLRVHGPVHRSLYDLAPVFIGLRDELESHLELEERELFPVCRALESAGSERVAVDQVVAVCEDGHEQVGDALIALRKLTGDYDVDHALCRTHRRLLEALRDLALDLHQHVHEENNILFPRVRAALLGWPVVDMGRDS